MSSSREPRVITFGLPWESGDRLCYVARRDAEPTYASERERAVHSLHLAIFGHLFHFQIDWAVRGKHR